MVHYIYEIVHHPNMQWETYKADTSIDLNKHHAPMTFLDKMAYWTVKVLRYLTDIFFQTTLITTRNSLHTSLFQGVRRCFTHFKQFFFSCLLRFSHPIIVLLTISVFWLYRG